MTQTTFLTGGDLLARARRSDPRTSHEAAESVDTSHSHRIVLDYLRALGPSTAEQIEQRASLSPSRVRGAIHELMDAGRVRVKSEDGRTVRGKACRVYELNERSPTCL